MPPKRKVEQPLTGFTFCITGKLSVARKDFDKFITDNGGAVAGTVTKACTHLVSSESGTKKCQDAEKKGVEVVTEDWVRSQVDGAQNKKKVTATKKPTSSAAATTTSAPVVFDIESHFNSKREEINVYLVGNTKKNKARYLQFIGGTYVSVFEGKISKPSDGNIVDDGHDMFDSIEEAKAWVTEKVLDALENKGYDLSTAPDASDDDDDDDDDESESEDEDTKFEHECNARRERADSAKSKGHGAWIKYQREQFGITTAAMAKKLKTTKGMVEKLESGSEPTASAAIMEELDNMIRQKEHDDYFTWK